jgi:hypothetical protein
VFQHTFSGVTYTVAIVAGAGGWILVGVNVDASTVIQAAVNYLGTSGGIIFIQRGVYLINTRINITQRSIVLMGCPTWPDQPNGTILKATATLGGSGTPDILYMTGLYDQVWSIAFEGDDKGVLGIRCDAQDGIIWNCAVHGCYNGIAIWANNVWVDRCHIEYNQAIGVYVLEHSYIWIINSMFAGNIAEDICLNATHFTIVMGNRTDDNSRYFLLAQTGAIDTLISAHNILHKCSTCFYVFNISASHCRIIGDVVNGDGTTANFLTTAVGTTMTDCKLSECAITGLTGAPLAEAGGKWIIPFVEFPVTYGTGGISLAGDVPVAALTNGQVAAVAFECPQDLQYLVRAYLKVLPNATQAAANWDLDSDYGGVGEAPNTHSESDAATTYNVTNNLWYDIELKALGFFANLAAGDRGGIKLTVSSVGHDVSVHSLRLEYL